MRFLPLPISCKKAPATICASALCDPGGTLTHDLQNRNLTFYTTELRSRFLESEALKNVS